MEGNKEMLLVVSKTKDALKGDDAELLGRVDLHDGCPPGIDRQGEKSTTLGV